MARIGVDDSEFRFAMVPEELIFDRDVALASKAIFAALLRFGNSTGRRKPKLETVAEMLGVSRYTIMRSISDLEANGWCTVIRIGGGKPNQYILHKARIRR